MPSSVPPTPGSQGPLALAVVTARGGSKGVPRKNLARVAGRSLTAHAVLAGVGAGLRVLLSTDDEEIRDEGMAAGALAPFLRPAELATDTATSAAVLRHSVDWMEQHTGRRTEFVVTLQPTTPLRTSEDVRAAVAAYRRRPPHCKSLITASDAGHCHPRNLYRVHEDGTGEPLLRPASYRRQDHESFWLLNGAIYITDRDYLMNEGRVVCPSPLVHVMPRWRSANIDEPFDLHLARLLFDHPFEGPAGEG